MGMMKDLYHNDICANWPDALKEAELNATLETLYGSPVKPKPKMVRKLVVCPDGLEGCAVAHYILTEKVSVEKVPDINYESINVTTTAEA